MNLIAITETSLGKVKKASDALSDAFDNIFIKPLPLWLNADRVTLIRIVCAFPVIFFLLNKRPNIAFWFFILGASSDFFDGRIARARKKETDIGKILDALADKILVGVTLLLVVFTSPRPPLIISPLLLSLILVFDVVLAFMGSKAMFSRTGLKGRLGSNFWGKCKFLFQAVGISLLLLQKPFLAQISLWVSVPFAIFSIIGHLVFKTPKPE
jgi:CDP-diacylglycerol--glycerol-3-phosphate 3-phosphatidyltransferase